MYKLFITGMTLAVMGVAFAESPNPDKAKAQATKLVDEPQVAVILTKAGKQMRVLLVSLDSKELQYKLRPTDRAPRRFTARSGEIKAVQIGSGEIFAVNPKTTAFEPYDPATETFTAAKEDANNEKSEPGREVGEGKAEKPKARSEKVVAEGVGATADEALKDAFRNAVRQVVGAVVDAETLLKNDEVISDKVLTYSDGFIKKYDEISNKKERGLFRVKIAANVERRSVVAKLKEARITINEVDGGDLYAKAVTTAEAQKKATELLKKGLQDLPRLLVATAVSKPEFDREKSEVILDVAIRVDRKAYGAWLKKMEAILEKVCLRKGSVLVPAELWKDRPGWLANKTSTSFAWPAVAKTESRDWYIWVNTSNNGMHTMTRWNWYVVDSDARETLKDLRGNCLVTVSYQDAHGELVTEEQSSLEPPSGGGEASLWQTVLCAKDGRPSAHRGLLLDGFFGPNRESYKAYALNLFICPYCFSMEPYSDPLGFRYSPQLTVKVRTKVTLDELKKITNVACKVVYTEEKPVSGGGKR
jgi:hypothetical protein